MEKIKNYFKNYFQKSSWFKITTDLIFYLLIILMIIPGTRKPLSEILIRATMIRPKVNTENITEILNNEDYNLIFQDLSGNISKIGDFKDEIVLINFWASWCPPCRAEMPALQELYNDYGNKMAFLFIADDQQDKVFKYLSEFNYRLPVYFLRSIPSKTFNIRSFPTTFDINKKGEILIYKRGAANWNSRAFRKKLDGLINGSFIE